MKILLANITTMVGIIGGVEKVFSDMANEFIKRGYEVSVVYSDNKEGKLYFELDEKVKCYNLRHLIINNNRYDVPDKKFPLTSKILREVIRPFNKNYAREMKENFLGNLIGENLKRVLAVEKPDLIISHRALTTKYLMIDAKTDVPIISMFHDDPKDILETATNQVKNSIEKSAAVQVLLPYGVKYVKEYCPNANVVVIPNIIKQFNQIVNLKSKDKYKIINIARLSKRQKRQHLLIEAFSLLSRNFANWQLELWGPTADKGYDIELREIIKKYGLEKKVKLCGSTNDVETVMRDADVFCLPSQFEGFALSLGDAMSIGLPVVGTRECLAISDIIVDKETGLLCSSDPKDIAQKLEKLMSSIVLRKKIGLAAHYAMQKYSSKYVWNIWHDIVKKILKEA